MLVRVELKSEACFDQERRDAAARTLVHLVKSHVGISVDVAILNPNAIDNFGPTGHNFQPIKPRRLPSFLCGVLHGHHNPLAQDSQSCLQRVDPRTVAWVQHPANVFFVAAELHRKLDIADLGFPHRQE